MKINGTTKIYGLIGNPVAHSLSPLLHNFLAEKMGHNLVYAAYPVDDGEVGKAIHGAYALGFSGLNVTIPFKSAVIPFLKDIDPVALSIGAVNTLVRSEDGFIGYNTDNIGLFRTFESEGIDIKGADVVILGAGGAARAAALLCREKKASRVFILNRSIEKAVKLANNMNELTNTNCLTGMGLSDFAKLPGNNLIAIQSTSVGMFPNQGECLIDDVAFYRRIKFAVDMIYNPDETTFMKMVTKNGGQAVNGLKMLLYQGVAAYELWNKATVPDEYIAEVYGLCKTSS